MSEAAAKLAQQDAEDSAWQREQTQIHAELAVYAAEVAGTKDDLDHALETAGLEAVWEKS